jgi:MFS family permease
VQCDDRAVARPWACPGFTRFWAASSVSGLGTYFTTVAVQVLVVVTLHQGSFGVGLVTGALWLPYLIFGLVAGVVVDRSAHRPLLVLTDLARAGLLIAVPVLALTHQLSVLVLMAFMAGFGLMSLFNDAASQSFLPRLVPPDLLTPANARLDQSGAVAQTSGPALAGGLVFLVGAPWAVLVDAFSYLISGLLIVRIPVAEPPRRPVSMRDIRREAAEGVRWIYRHASLRPLALSTHGWFLCLAITGAILTPYVLQTVGLDAFGLGLILSVGGVGGLLGSLAATRLGARFGAGRVVIVCRASTGLSWALVALSGRHWGGWLLLGAGQMLFGLSMGAENANEMGYWQAVTPDHLQGRMNATRRSINRAMLVIGAPVAGALGDAVGYRPMLWVSAAGFLVVAVALACSPFRHARLGAEPATS